MNQHKTPKPNQLRKKGKSSDSETLVTVDSPDDFSYEGENMPAHQRKLTEKE